jgi:hypothetical protein
MEEPDIYFEFQGNYFVLYSNGASMGVEALTGWVEYPEIRVWMGVWPSHWEVFELTGVYVPEDWDDRGLAMMWDLPSQNLIENNF